MTKKELEENIETLTKQKEQLIVGVREHIDSVDNLMQYSKNLSGKDLGVNLSKYITKLEILLGSVGEAELKRLFD